MEKKKTSETSETSRGAFDWRRPADVAVHRRRFCFHLFIRFHFRLACTFHLKKCKNSLKKKSTETAVDTERSRGESVRLLVLSLGMEFCCFGFRWRRILFLRSVCSLFGMVAYRKPLARQRVDLFHHQVPDRSTPTGRQPRSGASLQGKTKEKLLKRSFFPSTGTLNDGK